MLRSCETGNLHLKSHQSLNHLLHANLHEQVEKHVALDAADFEADLLCCLSISTTLVSLTSTKHYCCLFSDALSASVSVYSLVKIHYLANLDWQHRKDCSIGSNFDTPSLKHFPIQLYLAPILS